MQITIRRKWVVIGLFAALEIAFVVAFHNAPDRNRATILFVATVAGGCFALYTYLQGIDEKRSQYAYSLIERWNRADMVAVRLVLREVTEKRLDPATLMRRGTGAISKEVDEKRAGVVAILNFFEEVSIAARKGDANEDRLFEFFDGIVRQTYANLEEWIRHERKVDNEPHYYCEMQALYGRWIERRQASPPGR